MAIAQRGSRSVLDVVSPWLVLALSALAFGFSAFLDPEPHHDGVQIAPAIAISEGLSIHRDVYDHYGPITAWLHAGAVWLFEPTLLVIRLVTAGLLVAASLLMFTIGRRVLASSGMSLLLTATWIATWPGRSVDSVTYLFLPWPSITVLVLQLAVMAVLMRMISGKGRVGHWAFVLGLLVGIGAMTRLNTGIPIAIAVVLALAFAVDTGSERRTRLWISFATAALGSMALVVGILLAQGAFRAYLQDAILGPLAGDATDGTTSWFYCKNVVLLGSIPALAAIALTVIAGLRWPARTRLALVFGVIGVAGLTLWASTSIPGSPLRDLILGRLTWAPALDHQAFQPLFAMMLLLPICAVAVAVAAVRRMRGTSSEATDSAMMTMRGRVRCSPLDIRLLAVLALLALTSIVQLYPFIDPNHLWWAAPLPMILVLAVLIARQSRAWARAVVAVALLPALLIALPRAIEYRSQPRERLTGGVLDGMFIPIERVDDVRATDELLRDLQPGRNRFDCWNGLFAVWNGTYLADSSAFVNWAPGFDPDAPPPSGGRLIQCADPNSPDAGASLVPPGYRLLGEHSPVSISYYNLMDLRVFEPKPEVAQ